MTRDLYERAQLHAALGEHARLAIVDDLRTSDRSPAELAEQFDMSTNLVAHHLGVPGTGRSPTPSNPDAPRTPMTL